MTRRHAALEQRVARRSAALLGHRRRVLVALSGGRDSIALLHMLRFGPLRLDLHAAHFDHAMRADSAADAQWVRGLCTAWDVPLHSARAEDPPRSENAARELRYAFLHAAADACGAEAILTAHHRDDQAETVLFRLARGTGLAGMAGIPARRGIIVRPMLAVGRAAIVDYARLHRLSWREDPTNRSPGPARNRIRHIVLPELERILPGAGARIARAAAEAAAAERAWRIRLEEVLEDVVETRDAGRIVLARERLLAYDPHIRARVIRHLLNDFRSRPDRSATRSAVAFAASAASGRSVELNGGVRLAREFGHLLILPPERSGGTTGSPLRISAAEPGSGTFVAGGQTFRALWGPAGDGGAAQAARFDPSSLRFPLELRGWRPGDRIRLAYGSKKLKKLLQERRVGVRARAHVAVLVDADGVVLWAPGVARSALAPPRPGEQVLEITVMDDDSE